MTRLLLLLLVGVSWFACYLSSVRTPAVGVSATYEERTGTLRVRMKSPSPTEDIVVREVIVEGIP